MRILLTSQRDSSLSPFFHEVIYYPEELRSRNELGDFHIISREISQVISETNGKTVGFLDLHPDRFQVTYENLNLTYMLILAFPDIHWIFPNTLSRGDLLDDFHFLYHSSLWLIDNFFYLEIFGYEPLFDPLGIRESIKANIRAQYRVIPSRQRVAVAMDEEVPYALFNAYTAYKFGYRAWAIYTDALARRVLGANSGVSPDFTFEDLYLNFPDRPPRRHYSNLEDRDRIFPILRNVRRRYLVTVGHARTEHQREVRRENRLYARINDIRLKYIYKTYGGIYGLWKQAGFWRRGKPLCAEGYQWPPRQREILSMVRETEERISGGGHSAPGVVLAISQFMIERAKRILKDATTMREVLTAAVLALDAKELLMGMTPVTSMEALEVQHRAEVKAESMFLGVEYSLPVKERFEEIEEETKSLSRWFSKTRRKRAHINAKLTIAERLAKTFSDANQFEEEQAALNEARKLRFEFWVRQKPHRWILFPLLKYVEISLRSISTFFFIVMLWAFIFGGAYYGIGKLANRNCPVTFWEAFGASTEYYITLQSPQHWLDIITKSCPYNKNGKFPIKRAVNWNTVWYLLLAFQGLVSIFNIGLFISHIYLIISRR